MTPRNYIESTNPFRMAQPPTWWLDGIYHFDSAIVVMPSRQRIGVYWITRRRTLSLGLSDSAISKEIQASATDTAMFLTHHVEPAVDIVTPMGVWSLEKVLTWLRAHDTWAVEGGALDADGVMNAWSNGGSKFTKQFEAREAADERKAKAEQRNRVYDATGDGWSSLQRRKGSRISSAGRASQPAAVPPNGDRSLVITGV